MGAKNLTASQHEILCELKRHKMPFTAYILQELTYQPRKTIKNNLPKLERAGLVKRAGKTGNEVYWRHA